MNSSQIMTKIISIRYNTPLALDKIPFFRGAIIQQCEGQISEETFKFLHNHTDEGLIYSYPLVQYKLIEGKAGIVLIGEACQVADHLIRPNTISANIDGISHDLLVENASINFIDLEPKAELFNYRIRNWLPLNQANYEKFIHADGVIEQYTLLERILVGNVISMAKGLGISIEDRITCKITLLKNTRTVIFKGIKMLAFDLQFKSNIDFPEQIGLGKGVSRGFGVITKEK